LFCDKTINLSFIKNSKVQRVRDILDPNIVISPSREEILPLNEDNESLTLLTYSNYITDISKCIELSNSGEKHPAKSRVAY
jgi:hypothetical protein